MEREKVDGLEGDDERTENERSPPPSIPRSRPTTRDLTRKVVEAERRRSRSRGNTPAKDGNIIKQIAKDQEVATARPRRRLSRSRSSSITRDREQLQDGHEGRPANNHRENESRGLDRIHDNHEKKSNGNQNYEKESNVPQEDDSRNNENGLKKRRRVRLRNRNRHSRKRNHRHDRRYKPYTELSWEERKQRDDQESERAAMKRANRPTPYNTTQFLMEDHKVDTPDLSNSHMQCDTSDEIEDEMNGDYLERDFSAVYEEVQSERLEGMSKEQLVSEVLTLQRRVTELEEEQKTLRPSSAGESDRSSNGQQGDKKGLRRRLESLSSLEGEVQRLRSENSRLRKTSPKELVTSW